MELWPHQAQGITDIRAAFREHRRVLYQLPTGGGKTEMFAHAAANHVRKIQHGLVYILVHRIELMEQVAEAIEAQGERCGRIGPTDVPRISDRIVVASVQTLVRRLDRVAQPTFLIIDEAHHATARTSWGKVGHHYAGTPTLGVTATPCRLSGEGLSDCFDYLLCGPTTAELVTLGYLARPEVYCPAVPDLRGVHSQAGEYVSRELEKILTQSTITGDAIEAYKKLAPGQRFVAFGVSVRHIEEVAAKFQAAGINAIAIDGTLKASERKQRVDDFRAGRLTGLVSCQLVDEGFDVKSIQCGIDLSPTKSLGRYLQRIGRCLRRSDGKSHATILDLAGNALRHGLPDGPHAWTLQGEPRGNSKSLGERPRSVRICAECLGANASTSDFCGICGVIFPINGRTFIAQKGELELLREAKAAEVARKRAAAEEAREAQKKTHGYKALVAFAKQRRYRNPEVWAGIIHKARQDKKNKMKVRL